MKFDRTGKMVRAFGEGMILSPHGIFVDRQGNVWVTDCACTRPSGEAVDSSKGHQVFKFSPTGKLLLTLPAPGGPLAFSADGRMMASAGSRMIRVWDPYPHLTGIRPRPPAGDGVIRLWETKSWQERGRFAGHGDGVQALAFSADGRLLVSGNADDATGLVWDVSAAARSGQR